MNVDVYTVKISGIPQLTLSPRNYTNLIVPAGVGD